MTSPNLFTERLPQYLLAAIQQHAGGAAWPIALIPAVIEASRAAGLVSLGGDLQVQGPQGLWESPNVGVAVFPNELSAMEGPPANAAAAIALKKFVNLGGEGALIEEVMAGVPGAVDWPRDQLLQRLFFSWSVASA
jgi:hypothetical protein